MPRRATLNIFMPVELAAYILGLVASEQYSTAGEVVRAGLRILQKKEGPLPVTPPDRRRYPGSLQGVIR